MEDARLNKGELLIFRADEAKNSHMHTHTLLSQEPTRTHLESGGRDRQDRGCRGGRYIYLGSAV